jgi:hypothetical protein
MYPSTMSMELSSSQLVDLAAKLAGRLLRDVSIGGAETVQIAIEYQLHGTARRQALGDIEKGTLAQ